MGQFGTIVFHRMGEGQKPPAWRDVIVLLVAAVLAVVGADLGLRKLTPPKYVREVHEAMIEYEREDPTVLVIGSSHARSFTYMDSITRERTNNKVRVMSVPLEWGKFTSYEWVLNERLRPLIEEKEGGAKKRPSLKHFILVTAWWDACGADGDPPVFNLPSRAWTLEHFVSDVAKNGLNDHSRNYVTSRFGQLWHGSILVSDRGHDRLVASVRELVRPLSPEAKEKQRAMLLENWRGIMEHGAQTMGYPKEMEAAERILDYFQNGGYDVSLVLYPMMPITVTEFSRKNVQEPFQAMMKALAERRKIRFIDATFDNNHLTDADFQPDFDHLTPEGHRKFSEWLLAGQLSHLLDEGGARAGAEGAKRP
jgi:hypothetical protein